MQALTFDSKIDTWVMIFVVVISVLVAGALFQHQQRVRYINWRINFSTDYGVFFVVSDDQYQIYSKCQQPGHKKWFLKWNIKVNTIERVEKTKDFDSSPALSLDRIRITYSHNGQRKSVMISPKDQDQFLSILSSYRQVI